MANLKGVIIGVRNVLGAEDGPATLTDDTCKLLRFLKSKDIIPVVLSNSSWTVGGQDARKFLEEQCGPLEWLKGGQDVKFKQFAESLESVRNRYGWEKNEVLALGNTQDDMRSAVNGGILFLNARWYAKNTEYGILLPSPLDAAKIIDVFCTREHHWAWEIEEDERRVFAVAPFSTYKPDYRRHSESAVNAVKYELGDTDFWALAFCTSLYFSGVYADVDYVTSFPGHAGAYHRKLNNALHTFQRCFRGKLLPDLIHRHTKSHKSASDRSKANFDNQFNTIHLTKLPRKGPGGDPYAHCPLKSGKTVLVIDDVCTNGYALEAARTYLRKAGVSVIQGAWLKTINSDYHGFDQLGGNWSPFAAAEVKGARPEKVYGYRTNFAGDGVVTELNAMLKRYKGWTWPNDV